MRRDGKHRTPADGVVWLTLSSAGVSPSGKAAGFDPAIRRFESFHPSQMVVGGRKPAREILWLT